jgi:hypothetical protein
MNFRDRNYIIGSSRTESFKGAAFLSKMLGILHEKRVATPHAELVAVVNRRVHQQPGSMSVNGDFSPTTRTPRFM